MRIAKRKYLQTSVSIQSKSKAAGLRLPGYFHHNFSTAIAIKITQICNGIISKMGVLDMEGFMLFSQMTHYAL